MIYIGVTIIFFMLTWGLLKMCEVLEDNKSGEKS